MYANATALLHVALVVTLATGCASGQRAAPTTQEAQRPRCYVCPRTTAPIVIDGRLDDAAWADVPWTDPFVDIEGDARPQPRFRTRAKLAWDEKHFYIGAELEEPHVWATLEHRDEIVFHDNDFEIFIDPDGDQEQYYEIEVNALNTIFDLFLVRTYRAGGPALHRWDCQGMKSAVHVDGTLNDPSDLDRGWSVEFALPWATLAEAAHRPAPPKDGDTWRVNFSRVEWPIQAVGGHYQKIPNAPEDNWVWSPQGVIDIHRPQTWGFVQFAAH